jgi:hypothetical protein
MTEFGKDISCTDELRTGRLSTGTRLVAEACYRRLITPRGTLRGGEDEANYGTDISTLVGENAAIVDAIPGIVRTELLKDERIEEVNVTIARSQDGPAISLVIDIEGITAIGPFELQIGVSDVTTELLKVST